MFDFILDQLKQLKEDMTANKQEKADKIIKNSMVWSMGAGLIPIPIADMVAVTAIQVDMLKEICKIYEVNFSEHEINSWLTTLSGNALSKLGAEAIKIIPVVGTVLGGISMAAISGASTYATGQVFVDHFEKGGTLENFDAEKVKDFYKAQFEKGKAFAEELVNKKSAEKEEQTPSTATTNKEKEAEKPQEKTGGKDMFQQIKELTEMYEKGTLSKAEFEQIKAKILGN